jgi:hypothetical protein
MLVLADVAEVGTAEIPARFTPSLSVLESETGLGRSTVKRYLAALEDDGWITRTRPSTEEMWVGERVKYALSLPATRPSSKPSPSESTADPASVQSGPIVGPERAQGGSGADLEMTPERVHSGPGVGPQRTGGGSTADPLYTDRRSDQSVLGVTEVQSTFRRSRKRNSTKDDQAQATLTFAEPVAADQPTAVDLAAQTGPETAPASPLAGERDEPEPLATPTRQRGSGGPRGSRLPDDFTVTAEMVAWARANAPNVNGRRETEKFRDYFRALSGQKATKVDWPATWRNWMRKAADDARARASPRPLPPSNAPRRIPLGEQCPEHRGQRASNCKDCRIERERERP